MKRVQQGETVPGALPSEHRDNILLCMKNVFGRNLLKNWDAKAGLYHWEFETHQSILMPQIEGMTQIEDSTEKKSYGSQPLSELDLGTTKCWSASYRKEMHYQNIDLIEEGLTEEILDVLQPPITVSDWTAARVDCASRFIIEVNLLDKYGIQLGMDNTFEHTRDVPQWGDNSWVNISHTFRDYGKGVRKIHFCHGGRDLQFWEGNYGPKFTAPSVRIGW